jgi:hypothetical protein
MLFSTLGLACMSTATALKLVIKQMKLFSLNKVVQLHNVAKDVQKLCQAATGNLLSLQL